MQTQPPDKRWHISFGAVTAVGISWDNACHRLEATIQQGRMQTVFGLLFTDLLRQFDGRQGFRFDPVPIHREPGSVGP